MKKTPSSEDQSRAKELYFSFGTSKYEMWRECVIEEYDSYGITKEQENEWRAELLDREILKFDIDDHNTFFLLFFVIQNNCDINYMEKILNLVDTRLETCTHQYYTLFIGETILDLLLRCSEGKKRFHSDIKFHGLETTKRLVNKAKEISLPDNFKIPGFEATDDGLTQEQYVLKRITQLEHDIQAADV